MTKTNFHTLEPS